LIVIVMGVSGSGKSTVGTLLASALGCTFLEGDAFHPAANVQKMSHGIPLTDEDRAPWLAAIRARLEDSFARGESLVIACSALKQQYRDYLSATTPVTWVYLKGSQQMIRARLEHRREHFMKAKMLASQFADLEEPSSAIVADISLTPEAIVQRLLPQLRGL
jgi:gluconokinase